MAAANHPFEDKYVFKVSGREVVIQHKLDKFLRVHPQDLEKADAEGGKGAFARWKVHLEDGNKCKIQSVKSGKYLRITDKGDIDVKGEGGAWCVFRYHTVEAGTVKLQSDKFDKRYIAVREGEGVCAGVGGQWCELRFWR